MEPETRSATTSPRLEAEVEPEAETVLIQIPPDPDYLAVIRSASAHVATKLGCTLSEVSDLRLAIDEACGLLLRHTERDRQTPGGADGTGDLTCRFILQGSALRVVLSLRARDVAAPQDDEFGWTILSALVDDIVWRVEAPMVHVELMKRHAASG